MNVIAVSTNVFVIKGIVCDRCGVEVTKRKFVVNVWGISAGSACGTFGISVIAEQNRLLVGLPTKKLDSIIYYERYVVVSRVLPLKKA